MFNLKDLIPKSLKSFVVSMFDCIGCNIYYIGDTTPHLPTRIKKHLETQKKSNIFANLVHNKTCIAFRT